MMLVTQGAPSALGSVVIFDGFGDADINNNGIPLEPVDVNIQGSTGMYVPGRLAGGESPPVNHEVTTVLDSSDTGIRWLQMRGFTSGNDAAGLPGPGQSKPSMRIVDDTQGAMQETKAIGDEGGLGIAAIDSGYAMSWESRGGGSSAAGFFDRQISLGPEVGDEVKVSFDFRIWRDAPNLNGSLPNNVPHFGELRFGLFQDTDNQIGQVNPFAGRQVDEEGNPTTDLTPAQWGYEEGLFEGLTTGRHGPGDDVGTHGDHGWQASVFMGNAPIADGGGSRIREEVQSDRILQGGDMQTIALPQNQNPDPFGTPIYDFVNLDLSKVYNIALSLKRDTYVGALDSYSTIYATLIITDQETQEVWSYGNMEDDFEDVDPFFGGGVQSDSWDYFVIRNASSGTGATGGEFDFILDNFMVEVFGSNVADLPGDFDEDGIVDGHDFLLWQRNTGIGSLADWQANYGNSAPLTAAAAAVPEPNTLLLSALGLAWFAARRRGKE